MRKRNIERLLLAGMAAGMILSGCGGPEKELPEKELPEENIAGSISDGIFHSRDDLYTLSAPDDLWEVSELDGCEELRLKENPSVAITFSYLEDVPDGLMETFENEFAESFLEELSGQYQEVEKQETYPVSDHMAGFSVTMTDPEMDFAMYQLFYLAAEDEDACLITSILPANEAELLEPKVREAIESFAFVQIP